MQQTIDTLGICEMATSNCENASPSEPRTRRYETMEEYCTSVANGLPQRQAFYTIDLADVLWKVQEWKKCLPNVELFYAVKANSDRILVKLLALLGLSFDCATQGEIEHVLSTGVKPEKIIFAHTIKTADELRFASNVGVDMMTFDNETELLKIHREFPNARPLIRLSPAKVNCTFDLSDKFGCSEEVALHLLAMAKSIGIEVVGVSFHVGALCKDPASYESTIYKCRKLFDRAKEMGFHFSILDIGGGFLGKSGTDNVFHQVASAIRGSLDTHFAGGDVRLIAEPGCYVIASAVSLVLRVLGKRVLKNPEPDQPSRQYFLNDGVYGSFFKDIEEYGIAAKPLLHKENRPMFDSKLFGQTCCCMDVIRRSTPLPELEVGELLVWENMGAYSREVCSTFCSVPLPESKHVFVQNQRLNMEWMKNKQDVLKFLRKHAVVIGSKDI